MNLVRVSSPLTCILCFGINAATVAGHQWILAAEINLILAFLPKWAYNWCTGDGEARYFDAEDIRVFRIKTSFSFIYCELNVVM